MRSSICAVESRNAEIIIVDVIHSVKFVGVDGIVGESATTAELSSGLAGN